MLRPVRHHVVLRCVYACELAGVVAETRHKCYCYVVEKGSGVPLANINMAPNFLLNGKFDATSDKAREPTQSVLRPS